VSGTAAFVHAPLLQASVVHSFASSQLVHRAPPLPHTLALVVPGWHVVPSQHPLQHWPPRHIPAPFPQLVPSVTGFDVQVPFVQLPTMHSFWPVHVAHWAPPLPHAVTSVPAKQDVPLKQPVQQFPLKQRPPAQAVWSAAFVVVHDPDEHAAV
jgi:hypothetical protein